ncbi:TIGR03618 family F420-dependent PPOX class oxidoreductase [Streptomyces sp. NBC_01218]|uniref:TIGR03618 family F420-dependent PPOX class oxidoreductase n=1 Tax=unclassified Streptomyces TaxID=2593676 RepID=UPI0023B9FA25|nr:MULTISPECIES: TIGR03618 family F420-dependent PPOX class oxidoreductase [unclassified Streptomyces]WEH41160.1 TIGR03618 family F420-dependent PPOX class oxidoreductase [Streptomyces sp. AM 2-1-1]WSQ52795.1 TIGR03618 family F420-dependent PPOX class oxidoreductase [Streptomyces sp. NBC_01218]
MTQRPAPRPLSDEALSTLLGRQQFGTLATIKRSGHPHLTTMVYGWDPEARIVRFSSTADRVKVQHLRRNPRAALHVQGGDVWSFAVAEGEATVSESTTVPGDAVGQELLGMIPKAARPGDETAFLEELVTERRVVIRLKVDRLYGTVLDVDG